MAESVSSRGVFGLFDGTTSVAGILGAVGTHPKLLLPAVVGLAVASAVGMGAGEWLSEGKTSWPAVAMMAGATLAGTIIPALPMLLIHGLKGVLIAIIIGLCMALAIGYVRSERNGDLAYVQTVGVLVAATSLAILAARVGGGA